MDDWRLLSQYRDEGSQAAFGRLVDRHIRMVYWICRRDVDSDQLAEDAAQTVFLYLARHAPSLKPGVSIAGWLFRAARNAGRNAKRGEARRRHYEQEAVKNMKQVTAQEAGWQQIEPWINDSLSRLPDLDRDVLLLRYFEGLSFGELALATGMTEPAARMRVSRALARLRQYLLKKDVAVSSIMLPALMTEHAASAPPPTCRASVMQALRNISPAHAVHPINALLTKGLLIMSSTKIIAGGVAAVLLIIALTFVVVHRQHSAVPSETGQAAQGNLPMEYPASFTIVNNHIIDPSARSIFAGHQRLLKLAKAGEKLTDEQEQELAASSAHILGIAICGYEWDAARGIAPPGYPKIPSENDIANQMVTPYLPTRAADYINLPGITFKYMPTPSPWSAPTPSTQELAEYDLPNGTTVVLYCDGHVHNR